MSLKSNCLFFAIKMMLEHGRGHVLWKRPRRLMPLGHFVFIDGDWEYSLHHKNDPDIIAEFWKLFYFEGKVVKKRHERQV